VVVVDVDVLAATTMVVVADVDVVNVADDVVAAIIASIFVRVATGCRFYR
jgi:hypothetical protein